MRCGECGAAITAEEKTKHLKNGETKNYTYYRCTKRIKPCSQKPVTEPQLEEQINEALKDITIPHSFHEWAINELKTQNEIELDDSTSIRSSQNEALWTLSRKWTLRKSTLI